MMRRIRIRPQAERDLDDLVAYIARDNRDAAFRFLDAARRTFEQLAATPDLGILWNFAHPSLADVRAWRIGRFRNYLIFYRALEDAIEVIRILHGARDIESLFQAEED